jgi:uncharacterized phage protein gp47/JayE
MAFSLSDLLRPRSAQQILNDAFAFLANPPDPSLVSVRTANWRTGGPYRTLLYRVALEAQLLYQIVGGLAGSAFLRYARRGWLDWLGEDFFKEPRQSGLFATVNLEITVPAGAGPYGPLEVRAQTTDGKVFVSNSLVTIPAGPATTAPISFRAEKAGSEYNVGANTITQLIVPNILGLSVTNPAQATGGFDEESDDRYAQRLAAKWGVLSTGSPASAYVYWALTASPEVQKVRVYSNLNMGTHAPQWITVVLAGHATTVSAGAVAAVQAYIEPRIPLDNKLATVSCRVQNESVTGTVKVFTPYLAGAPAQISNGLQALGIAVPIGSYDAGPVPLAEFVDAIIYDRREIYDVTLTTPAAPVALDYDEILVPVNNLTLVGV